MATYTRIPSASEFKSKSNVGRAIRSADPILSSIDSALAVYQGAGDFEQKFISLTDLFFAINSWSIAFHKKSRGIEPARKDAIMDLFEIVMKTLGDQLGLTAGNWGLYDPRKVEEELDRVFGLPVNAGGRNTDIEFRAKFMTEAERNLSRIQIVKGKLFHFKIDGIRIRQELLNSADFEDKDGRKKGVEFGVGYAPFVMSLQREFYMTKHYIPKKNSYGFNPGSGVFHSTYLGPNKKVGAAGTLLVEEGKLKAIRGDSGHYKPDPRNMAHAIRAFSSLGVSLSGVVLHGYENLQEGKSANATSQMRNMLNRFKEGVSAEDFVNVYGRV